jgi:superoxide dismutase, Fe-Mn family
MTDATRRDFLKSASGAAAGVVVAGRAIASPTPSSGATAMSDPAPAFAAAIQPKPLRFDPAKLAGLSEKLIRSHWENNYGGSVRTLNAVKVKLAAALADKDTPPFLYGDLKREHLMRTGSVVMHELYFDNLGGNGKPDAAMLKALGDAFGSYDVWETEFRRIGASLAGGSGWVVAARSPATGLIENYALADHLHYPAGSVPLLVMDMYEHSYALDYGAAAAKYIDAFFQNVAWEVVAGRLEGSRATVA